MMRLAIFDNLANNAYIQAKAFRRHGHDIDVVLNPFDRLALSDPRWEDLDIEVATDRLEIDALPEIELPNWVRRPDGTRRGRVITIGRALGTPRAIVRGIRAAGPHGGAFAATYAPVIDVLRDYDCVLAFGFGPAVAALAGTPCVAQAYGGDVTIVPFADAAPGASPAATAEARLQRTGLAWSARIIIGDPAFRASVEQLGHAQKTRFLPTIVDTDKYTNGDEPGLRQALLGNSGEILVFVPARQN